MSSNQYLVVWSSFTHRVKRIVKHKTITSCLFNIISSLHCVYATTILDKREVNLQKKGDKDNVIFPLSNGDFIQVIMKYIEERGSPFSSKCPKKLQKFVTKEIMPEEIRKYLLQSSQIGKDKYQEFHSDRFITKSAPMRHSLHWTNLKTMVKMKEKNKNVS